MFEMVLSSWRAEWDISYDANLKERNEKVESLLKLLRAWFVGILHQAHDKNIITFKVRRQNLTGLTLGLFFPGFNSQEERIITKNENEKKLRKKYCSSFRSLKHSYVGIFQIISVL